MTGGDDRRVEVHLLDIEVDDNCGAAGTMVYFLHRIRAQQAFDTEEQLRSQIQADIDRLRQEFNL